mmetsp:Transcript_13477/g.40897  ORF Transcript_13477/g.40897 Transcript_13477/m.40897 type:complete len:550 (+) Transcript_13477:1541-3190(+)
MRSPSCAARTKRRWNVRVNRWHHKSDKGVIGRSGRWTCSLLTGRGAACLFNVWCAHHHVVEPIASMMMGRLFTLIRIQRDEHAVEGIRMCTSDCSDGKGTLGMQGSDGCLQLCGLLTEGLQVRLLLHQLCFLHPCHALHLLGHQPLLHFSLLPNRSLKCLILLEQRLTLGMCLRRFAFKPGMLLRASCSLSHRSGQGCLVLRWWRRIPQACICCSCDMRSRRRLSRRAISNPTASATTHTLVPLPLLHLAVVGLCLPRLLLLFAQKPASGTKIIARSKRTSSSALGLDGTSLATSLGLLLPAPLFLLSLKLLTKLLPVSLDLCCFPLFLQAFRFLGGGTCCRSLGTLLGDPTLLFSKNRTPALFGRINTAIERSPEDVKFCFIGFLGDSFKFLFLRLFATTCFIRLCLQLHCVAGLPSFSPASLLIRPAHPSKETFRLLNWATSARPAAAASASHLSLQSCSILGLLLAPFIVGRCVPEAKTIAALACPLLLGLAQLRLLLLRQCMCVFLLFSPPFVWTCRIYAHSQAAACIESTFACLVGLFLALLAL